mgnify:FL=1
MKKDICLVGLLLFLAACKSDDVAGVERLEHDKSDVSVNVEAGTSIYVYTDKACYAPGETVSFKVVGDVPLNARIRYRHLNEVVEEQPYNSTSWNWTLPSADFTGYMVDIYVASDNKETVYGTIAVDASSDWKRFPRYGFVAEFGPKTNDVINEEMAYLNRCHINGVQFQDWHNKHHWPLGSTRDGQILSVYKDIANRDVYTETVKQYIKVQHDYGMKSIFYNLCFGALDDAGSDGVKESWGLYKDYKAQTRDCHELPDNWKSNIYLVDPGNQEWQSYLAQRNAEVYDNLDFDGYQIDQLGDRGTVFNVYGKEVDLLQGYTSFINAMKNTHPDKRLIMNAVSRYGAEQIAKSGKVDFLYNEVWGKDSDRTEARFSHLKTIIDENNLYSGNQLNTVFAAYMNYWLAENQGEFNAPGVLLTDAVMFALGGSHLELGPHMLCKEYFPNNNLQMSESLKDDMIGYYDFMTAYQNILRDGGTLTTDIDIMSVDGKFDLQRWPPVKGKLCVIGRSMENKDIIHLLNLSQADSDEWRDDYGTMPEPVTVEVPSFSICPLRSVKEIWMATPDYVGGAVIPIAFKVNGNRLEFTLPSLKYWDMLVIEYK